MHEELTTEYEPATIREDKTVLFETV
jgi:hypothetical protein